MSTRATRQSSRWRVGSPATWDTFPSNSPCSNWSFSFGAPRPDLRQCLGSRKPCPCSETWAWPLVASATPFFRVPFLDTSSSGTGLPSTSSSRARISGFASLIRGSFRRRSPSLAWRRRRLGSLATPGAPTSTVRRAQDSFRCGCLSQTSPYRLSLFAPEWNPGASCARWYLVRSPPGRGADELLPYADSKHLSSVADQRPSRSKSPGSACSTRCHASRVALLASFQASFDSPLALSQPRSRSRSTSWYDRLPMRARDSHPYR